jgi:hypothetical protein
MSYDESWHHLISGDLASIVCTSTSPVLRNRTHHVHPSSTLYHLGHRLVLILDNQDSTYIHPIPNPEQKGIFDIST